MSGDELPSAARLVEVYQRALEARRRDPQWIARAARESAERAAEARRARADRREARLDAAQAPGDRSIRRWALADTRPEGAAIAKTMGLLGARKRREGSVIALVGPHGAGKTVALSRAIAEWDGSARYVRAATLSRLLTADRKSFRADADGEALRTEVERVGLLAIDELGDDVDAQVLVDLMVERIDEGLVTLCASNLLLPAWHARYLTPRFASRAAVALHLVDVVARDRRAAGP